jgi:hypothetical protein
MVQIRAQMRLSRPAEVEYVMTIYVDVREEVDFLSTRRE